MRHRIQTFWKHCDSPNITHCPKYMLNQLGQELHHNENAMFEAPVQRDMPSKFQDLSYMQNSIWRICYHDKHYSLNEYNTTYDIREAY